MPEAGWDYFREHGESVPAETFEKIRQCGAALFGAVSSPAKKVEGYRSAILTMRQGLDLYANIRPVCSLPYISPQAGVNMVIVRENSEGLYVSREKREGDTGGRRAGDQQTGIPQDRQSGGRTGIERAGLSPDHRAQGQCTAAQRRPFPRQRGRGGFEYLRQRLFTTSG